MSENKIKLKLIPGTKMDVKLLTFSTGREWGLEFARGGATQMNGQAAEGVYNTVKI